ncbi:MAG: ThuA domain-containing protein, partial [Verrucomicrobia bacterium]|nr:ThuA domain-containing protein [Verrucomicrobiota bacterium]
MRLPLIALIAAAMLCGCSTVSDQTAKSAKVKLLLITGDDVGPHKWQETAPATRDILVNSGRFDVKVVEDLACLENADELKPFDVIFFHRYDRTGVISDKAKENLLAFVKGGKGFAVAHLASASFGPTVKKDGDKIEVVKPGWDEFKQLCGRIWIMKVSGHGPRAPFKVKITNAKSPITKGVEDFEADDELYAKLQGDAKINVL